MKRFKFAISNYKESKICIVSFYQKEEEENNLNLLRELGDIEPLDPSTFENVLENLNIYDFGSIKIKDYDEIFEKLVKIKRDNKIPIIFYCNHLYTLFSVGICEENSSILVFDAHADLKNEYENNLYSKATWLRRLLELIDSEKVMIVGIRSLDEFELKFLREERINYITTFEIRKNVKTQVKKINDFLNSFNKVYISFDVDIVDASLISTNFPEPFGLDMFDIYDLINNLELNTKKIEALDFVEFLIENKESAVNLVSILFQFLKKLRS